MRNETTEMLNKIKLEKNILKDQYNNNEYNYLINFHDKESSNNFKNEKISFEMIQKHNLDKQNGINEILERYGKRDESVDFEYEKDEDTGVEKLIDKERERGGSALRLRIGLLGLTMGGGVGDGVESFGVGDGLEDYGVGVVEGSDGLDAGAAVGRRDNVDVSDSFQVGQDGYEYDSYDNSFKSVGGSEREPVERGDNDDYKDIHNNDDGEDDADDDINHLLKSHLLTTNTNDDPNFREGNENNENNENNDFDIHISDELSNCSENTHNTDDPRLDEYMNMNPDKNPDIKGRFLNSKNVNLDNSKNLSEISSPEKEISNKKSRHKFLLPNKKSKEILDKFRNLKDENYDNSKTANLFGIKGQGQSNQINTSNKNNSSDINDVNNSKKTINNYGDNNYEKRLKSHDNRFGQNLNTKTLPQRGSQRGKNEKIYPPSPTMTGKNDIDMKEIDIDKSKIDQVVLDDSISANVSAIHSVGSRSHKN